MELDLSFVTLDHVESKDILYPGPQITMHNYFHKLPRCSICRNIGFLPRLPQPAKQLTKIEIRRKTKAIEKAQKLRMQKINGKMTIEAYETVYDGLSALKPRIVKKILSLLLQASNLNYILFECTKCRVMVHATCCGGSFPTLDVQVILNLLTNNHGTDLIKEFLKIVKSLEWMCDYCCEEEKVLNLKQVCQICKYSSQESEILKTVQGK